MNKKKIILKHSLEFSIGFVLLAGISFSLNLLPSAERASKEYFFAKSENSVSNKLASVILHQGPQHAYSGAYEQETILMQIPFYKQEHALTCEIAAMRMSLNYLGVNVNESELLTKLEYSATGPRSATNMWGDPQKGFVGNIDGSIFKGTGFGVYSQPIARLGGNYRQTKVIDGATLDEVLAYVKSGKPVIVWGLLSNRYATYWASYEGTLIKALPGEHARVVMGYTGEMNNPDSVILMDPLYGKVTIETNKFLDDWKLLDNMAVVIN